MPLIYSCALTYCWCCLSCLLSQKHFCAQTSTHNWEMASWTSDPCVALLHRIQQPKLYLPSTGKSLSEAVIFASANPQYDDRLFIELQVQYMKTTGSEYVVDINCFFVFILIFKANNVHNMFWACSFHVLNQRTIFCHIVG